MVEGINIDIAVYKAGLGHEFSKFEGISTDRLKLLVAHSAVALRHFFATDVYGDAEKCGLDTLPAYWPYVRHLVSDALRPKFGYGEPHFVGTKYSDKWIEDIVNKALETVDTLPEDLTHKEWLFIVKVSAHMMMADPFLIDRQFVTEQGRQFLINQTLMAGPALMAGEDMYEQQFTAFKERFAVGPRNQ